MELAIGDTVVYGAHGAGQITGREVRNVLGQRQVVIILALAHGLSVELPLARAKELLRPVASAAEIARLGIVLRSEPALDTDRWLKRQRTAQAKLGTAVGLAEVVSEGTQRASVSPGERELLQRAKTLLAAEIALSRGQETSAASAWIDDQLARR
jgi:RNA polymerase-interacting CarD/CdnL/TRCF family regulator